MAKYDARLLTAESLTADQIGRIVGCYGPDALTRLRGRRDLRVTVVGLLPKTNGTQGPRKKLYRIEKVQVLKGPYCCGYCEQQRRMEV